VEKCYISLLKLKVSRLSRVSELAGKHNRVVTIPPNNRAGSFFARLASAANCSHNVFCHLEWKQLIVQSVYLKLVRNVRSNVVIARLRISALAILPFFPNSNQSRKCARARQCDAPAVGGFADHPASWPAFRRSSAAASSPSSTKFFGIHRRRSGNCPSLNHSNRV